MRSKVYYFNYFTGVLRAMMSGKCLMTWACAALVSAGCWWSCWALGWPCQKRWTGYGFAESSVKPCGISSSPAADVGMGCSLGSYKGERDAIPSSCRRRENPARSSPRARSSPELLAEARP